MVERTRRDGDVVVIDDPASCPGENRLPRGREMRAGEVVLARGRAAQRRRGSACSPRSAGPSVAVVPRPRVVVVPTGDELVEPDQVPGPGQIRNSNAVDAPGAGRRRRGPRPTALPIAPDEPGPLRAALGRGLAADVLLITGGVSAGQPRPRPRDARAARRSSGSSTRSGSSRASRSGSASARARGEAARAARLRSAGQPGQRHRRLPAVRPPGARGPRRARPGRAIGRSRCPARASVRPHRRPADVSPGPDRLEATWPALAEVEPLDWAGSADLQDGGPGRRLRHLPGGRPNVRGRVKLSDSCPWGKIHAPRVGESEPRDRTESSRCERRQLVLPDVEGAVMSSPVARPSEAADASGRRTAGPHPVVLGVWRRGSCSGSRSRRPTGAGSPGSPWPRSSC